MGSPSWEVASEHCDALRRILIRMVGTAAKGRDSSSNPPPKGQSGILPLSRESDTCRCSAALRVGCARSPGGTRHGPPGIRWTLGWQTLGGRYLRVGYQSRSAPGWSGSGDAPLNSLRRTHQFARFLKVRLPPYPRLRMLRSNRKTSRKIWIHTPRFRNRARPLTKRLIHGYRLLAIKLFRKMIH